MSDSTRPAAAVSSGPGGRPAAAVPSAPGDPAPLAGLRVIEVSSFVASPLGGLTLAQLGAEVIRVDPLGGAPDVRRWPLAPSGTSLYWTGLNKGKRSVVVDIRSAAGQRLVADLVAASGAGGGIVLTNVGGQPWIGYDALARVRPDLIHLQVLGRSDGGPAVDYTVNAAAGFPLVTGPGELGGPVNQVLPAWDIACGLYAAVGLLAAERHRRLTGAGRAVSLALEDVALALAGNLGFLGEAQVLGADRPRIGNHLFGGFGRDFATSDGRRVMLLTLTPRHWSDLGRATGLTETFTELERLLGADFSTDGDRYAHREVLAALVSRWCAGHTLAEVSAALSGTSVLWSVYRSFREMVGDPRVTGNPVLGTVDQPGVGPLLVPASPLVTAGARPAATAPALGADTAAVLTELLGLSAAGLAALARDRVIGAPAPG